MHFRISAQVRAIFVERSHHAEPAEYFRNRTVALYGRRSHSSQSHKSGRKGRYLIPKCGRAPVALHIAHLRGLIHACAHIYIHPCTRRVDATGTHHSQSHVYVWQRRLVPVYGKFQSVIHKRSRHKQRRHELRTDRRINGGLSSGKTTAAHTHSAFRPLHISPERAQRIDKRIDRTRHEAGTTGNHHISPRSSGKHCHAETERRSAFSCISHSGAGFSHTPHGLHVGTFGQHAVICSTRRSHGRGTHTHAFAQWHLKLRIKHIPRREYSYFHKISFIWRLSFPPPRGYAPERL